MNKMRYFFCFFLLLGTLFAQVPTGYYNAAVGKSGEELRTALYNIIKSHTALEYNPLWQAFQQTDAMPSGKVWDIYSDNPEGTASYYYAFGTDQCGSYSQEGDCYNREHTVPQSWFNDALPMKTDLFHVYPTDGLVNGKRGNYAYGEVSSPTWTSSNGSKLGPCAYPNCSGTVFEPIDAYKGDLARAYFYMSVCYKDKNLGQASGSVFSGSTLVDWAKNMFVSWHTLDPVSQKEIDRNETIYQYFQHNRNPFIDCPELVQYVFGAYTSQPWYPTCVEWTPDEIEEYHLADYQECTTFPNPVSSEMTIQSNYLPVHQVDVFDFAGRLVRTCTNLDAKIVRISVENLSSGCYFLKIFTDQTCETVKMMVR